MASKRLPSEGREDDTLPGKAIPPGTAAQADSAASPGSSDILPFDLMVDPPSPPSGPGKSSAPAAPPVATPAPSPEALVAPLEDRMRRLEDAINHLGSIQKEPTSSSPQVIDTARALVDVSRTLLPSLQLPPKAKAGWSRWFSFSRDIFMELQAIYYMYVDPRYRMSWFGRFVPLALLVLFATSSWWLSFFACGLLTWMTKPVDLVLLYFLFKILGVEATHYRETAPDLPPGLRLDREK